MYRLPHGRQIPDYQAEKHHCVHYERWFKTPHEKLYRNLAGLVLPMHRPIHRELHANVPPPPKPSREFMLNIIDHTTLNIEEERPYPRFLEIVKYIGDMANTSWSDERVDEASRLYENFTQQNEYLKQGVVERV